jgi:HK97 family phage prohead protease
MSEHDDHDHGDGLELTGRDPHGHGDLPSGPGHYRAGSVDNSAWDGPAAMSAAGKSDHPAAAFRAICAGKKAGDPKTQKAWALPHHKHPGDAPNANGVRNALSSLPKTNGLLNAKAAQHHLEAHLSAINAAAAAATPEARRGAAEKRGVGLAGQVRRHRPADDQAYRLAPAPAQFRHQPVTLNGKSMHQLDGYASVVGVEYEMWDMFGPFGETIDPKAFDQTLAAGPDVAFLVNHKGLTMARTTNGTLTLEADPRGLHALAFLNPARVDVADLLTAIDDTNITEMSFAFRITDAEWSEDYEHFTILSVDIDRGDVSAVNYGANPYTSIAARSREIMSELDRLPEGAGQAALWRLASRFHIAREQLVPMDTDGTEPLAGFGPAGLRAAAKAQVERERLELAAQGDPVVEVQQGRSLSYIEALLKM